MRTTGKIRMRMGILAACGFVPCADSRHWNICRAEDIETTRTMRGNNQIQEPRTGMHNRTGTEPALILILDASYVAQRLCNSGSASG